MSIDNVIDISMDLNEKTVVWVKDPQPKLEAVCRMPQAPCNFTWLNFGAHAGTHIDAPYFLFPDKWTSDKIPLDRLMGRCQVLDLTDVDDMIDAEHLQRYRLTQPKVLLKTKNSCDPMECYNPAHVAMTPAAGRYLLGRGVQTLGYDYQSFERDGQNVLHRMFLEQSVTLIDNLRLAQAKAKEYYLMCLPVKVTGIDGAPARAILIEEGYDKLPKLP